MVTDPIADMLTRMRNAAAVSKGKVVIPASKLKAEILKVLKNEGYITDFAIENESLVVNLEDNKLKKIIRVSKPGRRVYAGNDRIPVVLQGHGLVVISTPKGVMSGKSAKNAGLGGEVLCKVW
jgi:small subunit ribosomal protein S8